MPSLRRFARSCLAVANADIGEIEICRDNGTHSAVAAERNKRQREHGPAGRRHGNEPASPHSFLVLALPEGLPGRIEALLLSGVSWIRAPKLLR